MADQPEKSGGPHALPTIHAVVFHGRSTPIEFKIAFGQRIMGVGDDGGIVDEDVTMWAQAVTMSPQAAKQLSQLLVRQLAYYEENVGEIKGVDLTKDELAADKPAPSSRSRKPRPPRAARK